MIKTFRHKKIQCFFCFLLALVVFNLSIDPPDLLQNIDADPELEEDLSVNEIESISELILEQGFHWVNAVPETDDPDSDNIVKKVEIYSAFPPSSFDGNSNFFYKYSSPFFYNYKNYADRCPDILTPPPRV